MLQFQTPDRTLDYVFGVVSDFLVVENIKRHFDAVDRVNSILHLLDPCANQLVDIGVEICAIQRNKCITDCIHDLGCLFIHGNVVGYVDIIGHDDR